uniref:Prepilin-type N-terminal cleavage/methylation domain-containing protein n=1 Tax=Desulfovibrio sp. U5L TaxID=596152 RepID=I2Q4Q4_9BACT
MPKRCRQKSSSAAGFTLIEMLCAMVILALVGLLSTSLLETFVRGYNVAKNSDATIQKAQNALQRLTLEFTYLNMVGATGTKNSIAYNSALDGGVAVNIFQDGNTIVYKRDGTKYILTDGVAADSLAFRYFKTYDGTALEAVDKDPAIKMIGFQYNMVGSDPSLGFSQTYGTRVTVNKVQ